MSAFGPEPNNNNEFDHVHIKVGKPIYKSTLPDAPEKLEIGTVVEVYVNYPHSYNGRSLVLTKKDSVRVYARIVEVGDCRWELTRSKANLFQNLIETADEDIKQVLSLMNGDIDAISDANKYKPYIEKCQRNLNLHSMFKMFNKPTSMKRFKRNIGINRRRIILNELINDPDCPGDLKTIFESAYDVIKKSQIIKVEYIGFPAAYAYYVAHDCSNKLFLVAENLSLEYPNPIADEYEDGIVPIIDTIRRRITSRLPDVYSLEQITEINSWLTHGMLSAYLFDPGWLKEICVHPLIGGNEVFWYGIGHMMEKQYQILFNLTKPLETEIIVYRGSPHYKSYPSRQLSVFATSTNEFVANGFGGKAKIVNLPAGTRVLDLTNINKKEREILVFPNTKNANLIIEPLNIEGNETKKRFTYRIRNPMNQNRNVVKIAGKPAARRRTRRR
jgi:hypothetical protein